MSTLKQQKIYESVVRMSNKYLIKNTHTQHTIKLRYLK